MKALRHSTGSVHVADRVNDHGEEGPGRATGERRSEPPLLHLQHCLVQVRVLRQSGHQPLQTDGAEFGVVADDRAKCQQREVVRVLRSDMNVGLGSGSDLSLELGSVVDPVADVRNGLDHGGTRMST